MTACVADVNVTVPKLKLLLVVTRGVNEQVNADPEHTPDQLVKALPAAGVAVSVIAVKGNAAVQTVPQLMPAGLDVIVPVPLPALLMTTVGRMLTVALRV